MTPVGPAPRHAWRDKTRSGEILEIQDAWAEESRGGPGYTVVLSMLFGWNLLL